MPFGAMCFAGIQEANAIRFTKRVILSGGHPQMIWIDTRPIFACVMNNHCSTNYTEGVEVCDAMSAAILSAKEECSIPVGVERAIP